MIFKKKKNVIKDKLLKIEFAERTFLSQFYTTSVTLKKRAHACALLVNCLRALFDYEFLNFDFFLGFFFLVGRQHALNIYELQCLLNALETFCD